ncbi:MAG TPA: carboxypeptidase-like regulatory domain-containing protein, partial [Thermoanaerobaculia bacterium]
QNVSHNYATPGNYPWSLKVTQNGQTCNRSGSIVIASGESSTLSGTVFEGSAKSGGAAITLGSRTTQTDGNGNYAFADVLPGAYPISVNKAGFSPITEQLTIPPKSGIKRDFSLTAIVKTGTIAITGLRSTFPGRRYYLSGIDNHVPFTASVDWAGHKPGTVAFNTPRRTFTANATSTNDSARQVINVGAELNPCEKLTARATSIDGEKSGLKTAEFVMMSVPSIFPLRTGPANFFHVVEGGDDFYYEMSAGSELDIFHSDTEIPQRELPDEFPRLTGKLFALRFVPILTSSISSTGHADFDADFTNGSFEFFGKAVTLTPKIQMAGTFQDSRCSWGWTGYAGGTASMEWESPHLRLPAFPLLYVKARGKVELDALAHLDSFDPFRLEGAGTFKPRVGLDLGAGVDFIFAVAVRGEIGVDVDWQMPQTPRFPRADVVGDVRVGIYGLLHIESSALHCQWSIRTGVGGCNWNKSNSAGAVMAAGEGGPSLVSRDYLQSANYAMFHGDREEVALESPQAGANVKLTALQTNVFPYSEPSLSTSGSRTRLSWLYDNPARSSVNRTEAVSAQWDGTRWDAPQAIADNGTADFHPNLISFDDGSALAAWEDVKTALPDSANRAQIASNLEVAVASFNPASRQWTSARLTTNAYVDRSPRIAAASATDAIAIWIANPRNDLEGRAGSPNDLYWVRWNGGAWSNPAKIATLP